jgi:hypothetical protein
MSIVDQSPGRAGTVEGEIAAGPPAARWAVEKTSWRASTGWLVVMSILSAALAPSRMLLSTGPQDDGPVFAYIGWAMKHGLMPYRDIWDHKGPLLYYLQLIGSSLSPDSTVGIGVLELIAYAMAFFPVYRVIASFSSWRIGFGVALFSAAYVLHFSGGGNMTETWSLLPLAAGHYAAWRWSQRLSSRWCPAAIGICLACIFWLRANMIVFPLLATLLLLYETGRSEGVSKALRRLALASGAGLALSVLILTPLFLWGIFHDLVAAYFGYNAAYSNGLSLASRYEHTTQLLGKLFVTAIAVLGVAGWILGVERGRRAHQAEPGGLPSLYLKIVLWSLPFELAAATLSGRDYPHYLLPLFPTLAVLGAWFLSEFERQNKMPGNPALVMPLLLALCGLSFTTYPGDLSRTAEPTHPEYLAVARFIRQATTMSDKITVVGETDAPFLMLLSRRLPASRFVYQLPLIDVNNPAAGEQRRQFMCEIAQNRPAVLVSGDPILGILCASRLNCPQPGNHPPISEYGYQSTVVPQLLREVVVSQYRPVEDSRFGPYKVLLRNDIPVPAGW